VSMRLEKIEAELTRLIEIFEIKEKIQSDVQRNSARASGNITGANR
jgi:hypothetical protein